MKNGVLRDFPAGFAYETAAEEHIVRYTDSEGRKISLYGRLRSPAAEGKFPAVIMSHGFNGRFSDFAAESELFASRGYVCYGFDFCGAQADGRSAGRSAADYTPFTMKEDLRAAITDVSRLPNVGGQIFLLGGSQGGFVTALTAADGDVGELVSAIVLYFPAFNIPDDWRGKPARETPLMGYSVGAKYIASVQDLDPFAAIGNFGKDVCILWGDRDTIVGREYVEKAARAYGTARAELEVIRGAGHGFRGEALETAAKKALAFLEARTLLS